MIRAVVFDFDGVIANTEPLHYRAYRDVLADRGITLTESSYYGAYLGFDDAGAFRAIAADNGSALSVQELGDLIERKAKRLEALEREMSVLFPGAREAVERLSGEGVLAIASGALRAEILRVLERERLTHFFPVVVAAEDTPASKPDPAPYALAVRLLAAATGQMLEPAECVAVEDSRWGLASARGAGLATIAITNSYPPDQLPGAHAVVTSLDVLTWAFLRNLQT